MRVGFIGLGDIGMPMAQRLLESDFEVIALDLNADKVKQLEREGGSAAADLAGFGDCEVVCLAVPDDPAVKSIAGDDRLIDAVSDSASILIHSTILPTTALELAETLKGSGVAVHDAPVSGGAGRARTGDLTIMLGGETSAAASEVLDALGTPVSCGALGAGAAVKLANQLSMLASLAALHEGLALAEHFGASERLVLEVLSTSTGASWSASNWGFFDKLAATYDDNGVELRYRPWSKDLWDFVASARAADLHVPLAGLLSQIMPEAVEDHARAASRKEA